MTADSPLTKSLPSITEPMRQPAPPLVDIPAVSVTTATSLESRSYYFRSAIQPSLGVDSFLALASLLIGLLLGGSVNSIETATGLSRAALLPPSWLIVLICGLPALVFLFVDVLSAFSNPATLPFARSRGGLQKLYARRLHVLLLVGYFASILVALCWSAVNMLLVSKLFISAVFALALYALGQSIPSRRLSFVISGILFLVVLLGIQAFIVAALNADSSKSAQDDFGEPEPSIPLYDSDDE